METTTQKIIPIFFAVDDNYAPLLHVAVESIISQASSQYDYHIHILFENLNEENRKSLLGTSKDKKNFQVMLTNMQTHIFTLSDRMHLRDYYTKTIYFRVFIANMFPEYNKALYLDTDVVLNSDVSELYNFDLEDNFVGAITCETVDTTPVFTNYAQNFLGVNLPYYFNTGVLLLNLEVLRKVKFQERFFDIASKVKFFVAPDQDYFNVLCHGKVKFLPEARNYTWNKTPCPHNVQDLKNIKLVHYNLAYRPWRYDNIPYAELFWKHAQNTVVFEKMKEIKKLINSTDLEYDQDWMDKLIKLALENSKTPESIVKKIKSGQILLTEF